VNLIAALLYLPWVLYAGPRLTLYVSQKVVQDADRPLGLVAYLARHLAAFAGGHLEGPLTPWWPLMVVVLLPAAAGLVLVARKWTSGVWAAKGESGRKDETRKGETRDAGTGGVGSRPNPVAYLGVVLLVALLLGWLIGLRYPFFPDRGERLLLLALPSFVMLFAAGLAELARVRRWLGVGAGLLLVAASGVSLAAFYTIPRYAADDYRNLIARTVEQGLPEDTVFCVYPWQVGYWRSYAAGSAGPTAVLTPSARWDVGVQSALEEALQRGRVWFPAHLALGAILETQVEQHLAARALPFGNTWYGPGTRLSAWYRPAGVAATAGVESQPLARYALPAGQPLTVSLEQAPKGSIPAANAVAPLALRWISDVQPPELAVSVRLVDDLGQIWAQNDYAPLGGMAGTAPATASGAEWQATDRLGLLIPAGTPPGEYRVQAVVSPGEKAAPLQATRQDGAMANSADLLRLNVAPADRTLEPERLPVATRMAVDLADGIRFLGYSIDRTPLAPGASRRVNLFWQTTATPAADYTAFVQLLGQDGAPVAGWEAPPGAGYPTSQWTPGTVIRTQATLRAPAELADGRYSLIAGLYRPADGLRLKTAQGKDELALGRITLRGRRHDMSADSVVPATAQRLDVRFGETARLVGYDGPAATGRGELALTLYWQALRATDAPYTVFVHLVDEQSGAVIGYGDSEPGRGAYPTTGWLKGEHLGDPHTITFAPIGGASRQVRIEVGLYDPGAGQRLTLPDGADALILWRGELAE
jgi:hypothetical protein